MLRRLICLCFVAVLAFAGLAASAQTYTPARDNLLSARNVTLEDVEAWAEEFLALNPDVVGFDILEPGHILVTTTGDGQVDLFLDNLMARLDVPAKQRANELAIYEANLNDTLTRMLEASEPDPGNVLPIIRHRDFLSVLPADAPPEQMPVSRPLAGDAVIVLAYDSPNGIGVMSKLSMGIENLSDDEAIDLAVSNFERFSQGFTWEEESGIRFAVLDTNYESSLMLLDSVWTDLEAEIGGPVAAAIPTRGLLLVGRADVPDDVALLRDAIAGSALDPYSVSEDVFVRRDGEWAVLEP